jgi:N-acetylglucosaminyldiphosphoundecaprenol N-acetyl-beta-D-mannosaminyltransferase
MKEFSILDVKIDKTTKDELLKSAESAIEENKTYKIYTVNNEFVVEAQNNKKYLDALNNSDVSIADSTGVVWAIKKLYGENIERIPGADLFYDLFALANKKALNVFFFGGSEGIGEKAKHNISKRYPNVSINVIDGASVTENEENKDIVDQINKSNSKIVFVALGSPKQELWIENHLSKLDPAVFIGIGGTLDYVSGKIRRAPEAMREIGLEWLYRLIVQPSRYKRIYKAVITFPNLVNKAAKKTID